MKVHANGMSVGRRSKVASEGQSDDYLGER
jgi:hypothetical protein